MGKQERRRDAEVEGKHRLQVSQVVGAGFLVQDEQAIDVGVDQGLWRWVVLEHGEGVFAVFGFHRFAVEFELCTLEQQQRATQLGYRILELRVLDGVQGLLELRSLFFKADLTLLVAGRARAE
ncbi:hypothetical protein D3C81_1977170 [compost metagenome]